MENIAATQLPSIQKRHFATAFQAKDIENAQKQAVQPKTEDATNYSGPFEHGMLGLHRESLVLRNSNRAA